MVTQHRARSASAGRGLAHTQQSCCSLKDLCPEDKQKVAKLLRQVDSRLCAAALLHQHPSFRPPSDQPAVCRLWNTVKKGTLSRHSWTRCGQCLGSGLATLLVHQETAKAGLLLPQEQQGNEDRLIKAKDCNRQLVKEDVR